MSSIRAFLLVSRTPTFLSGPPIGHTVRVYWLLVALLCLPLTVHAGPLCGGCSVHQVRPYQAAHDSPSHAGLYHPDQEQFAFYSPNPSGPHPGSGKLLVFLAGHGGKPAGYTNFLQLAADRGYHVVGVSYWNLAAFKDLCNGVGPDCGGALRKQLFDGTLNPNYTINGQLAAVGSTAPKFGDKDMVRKRLVEFVVWLHHAAPSEHWGQFLADPQCKFDDCRIEWKKVVLAGHSMGGGEAALIASERDVERIIMLSAPTDINAFWTSTPRTHPEKYYGLAQVCDTTFYQAIAKNWTSFAMPGPRTYVENGLTGTLPDSPMSTCPVLPASATTAPPYGHSHQLVSGFNNGCAGGSGHNQVAANCNPEPAVLLKAWDYLLGVPPQ